MAGMFAVKAQDLPSGTSNPPVDNLIAAQKELNLSQEESALYRRHLTNLYGSGGVDNPNGSRSTLYQTTVGFGDRYYLLPRVWKGKIVNQKEMIENVKKTGLRKFPSYGSVSEAEKRYGDIHKFMEKDTARYMKNRKVNKEK